jgi:hypothetical protein
MIIVGVDLALRNVGLVKMRVPVDPSVPPALLDMRLIKTVKSTDKKVRKSSDDVAAAREVIVQLRAFTQDSTALAVEVPGGAQSYGAANSFGIAKGIIAGFYPVIEVQPRETKLYSVGNLKATKDEMVAWARERYPAGEWLTRKLKGKLELLNDNEHLADAIAVVYAARHTDQFKFLAAAVQAASKAA